MSSINLTNQSTKKALSILEYLASQPEPVQLRDIAKNTEMNISTTARFVNALQDCHYIGQDPDTSRYFATMKICAIANQITSHFNLASVAHPYVLRVSNYFMETACCVIQENQSILYIDIALGTNRTLMNIQRVGNSAPMHSTAAGKLFLSRYTEQELDRYIEDKGLKEYTPNTITNKKQLIEELDKIRMQGYSLDDSENEVGIRCISYPIYDYAHNIVACLSITAPSVRLSPAMLAEKQNYLAQSAMALSHELGCEVNYFNN